MFLLPIPPRIRHKSFETGLSHQIVSAESFPLSRHCSEFWQHSRILELTFIYYFVLPFLPVRLLLLVLQVPVRLLQFVRENLQIPGQLVLCLELLGQQHQVSGGVMQRNVADEQSLPAGERERESKKQGIILSFRQNWESLLDKERKNINLFEMSHPYLGQKQRNNGGEK